MTEETVVLYPFAGMGHLAPTVELAKLLVGHGFAVTVVLVHPPNKPDQAVASLIDRVSSLHPAISFHRLPPVSDQPNRDPPLSPLQVLLLSNALLRDFLHSLRGAGASVRALVLDMFCTAAFDVADELRIPAYLFFTSAASCFAAFLHLPTILSSSDANFKDLGDAPLHFPGLPPIPASHIPVPLQDRSAEACKAMVEQFERFPRADAVLVNSFESLEPRAVRALADGLCPSPVYCIGPLIMEGREDQRKHECLSWLDKQPEGSVVFLCFGSAGSFTAEQLKEMAEGLERSGQRFLWVVRSPKGEEGQKDPAPDDRPDLDRILPEGFVARTEGRGLVVGPWAPQAEVLGHAAVGGFVSHCGWNSTLEAVCAGVPMIAWPLYAEQKMNKVLLAEEMRLAEAVEGTGTAGVVGAAEVAAKVRWLMESEGGRELRGRMRAAKERAAEAWGEGGSSRAAWMEVVSALKGGE